MKVSFVSSAAISNAMRSSLMSLQAETLRAQKEQSTGEVADRGLSIGAQTARTVTFERDIERLKSIVTANGLVSSRLTATQGALTQLSELSSNFLATLMPSASGNETVSDDILKQAADGTLSTLYSVINTSLKGEYIFAGVNTDVQPLTPYEAGSPAKIAFDAGFQTFFGFPQNDPQAQTIPAADMQTFLDTVVTSQFMGGGWQDWSRASDQTITSRIAMNETVQTSVSANNDGVRQLTMAAAMISDLMSGNLGPAARDAMVGKAIELVTKAVIDLAETAGRTGLVEQRIEAATDRVKMQQDLFTAGISDLVGVDPYEVATRLSSLTTQVEQSLAITARIKELSLLRYIS